MSALPILSGQLVKALGRVGYAVDRQRADIILAKASRLSAGVPDHAEMAKRPRPAT